MEGVGAVANVVVNLSVKVVTLCSQYAEDARSARSDIEELRDQVTALRRAAKSARRLIKDQHGASLEASRDMEDALRESLNVLRKLVESLQYSTGRRFMRLFRIRVLRWPLKRRDVNQKIKRIRRCTKRINLALQVYQTAIIGVDAKVVRVDETMVSMEQRMLMHMLPTALGALYDSREEEDGATCLTGTRVELLRDIDDWVNSRKAPTVFWLNGMAGTGKSTISRTVAATAAMHRYLGASFFFKRGETDRANMSRFYTTIAYQLVRSMPDLVPHIRAAISGKDSVIEESADKQFEKLILQPLMRVRNRNRTTFAIIVDGLDECDGDDDIRRLISLLSNFKDVKNFRVRVLITSRPELPSRLGFHDSRDHHRNFVFHEISETNVEHDVEIFLRLRLDQIRRGYNRSVSRDRQLPKDWPASRDTATLVRMAGPLFIFATTVCRYLSDRRCGNPREQLRKVLKHRARSQEDKMEATYLPPLEQQLTGMSNSEKGQVLDDFRTVVGTIVLLETPLPVSALAGLLDVREDTVHARLDMLHSVLNVPESADSPIRLLHQSFREFLTDPGKRGTNEFWVDEKYWNSHITSCCLRIMNDALEEDICGQVNPGADRSSLRPGQVDSSIPPELKYACRFWARHLRNAERSFYRDQEVYDFLSRHFLHWIEVLSLIERPNESYHISKSLQVFLHNTPCSELGQLLKEAPSFIQRNLDIINSHPLQLYSSLLSITPENSLMRRLFWGEGPSWVSLIPAPDSHWGQVQYTLEGHKGTVNAVAFSPDSSLLASASSDHNVRIWRVETGECIREFQRHKRPVRDVKFSPDSTLIASKCDETIRIWKSDTGIQVENLAIEGNHRECPVEFSPDSKLVAWIGERGDLRIMQLDTLQCIWQFRQGGFTDPRKRLQTTPYSLHFSSDSKTIAVVVEETGFFSLWSVESGYRIRKHEQIWNLSLEVPHNSPRRDVSYSFVEDTSQSTFMMAGNEHLHSESDDTILVRWVETGEVVQSITTPYSGKSRATSTLFSPDGAILGSIHEDKTVKVWEISTGNCLHILSGFASEVKAMSFSPDMRLVASGSTDKMVHICSISSGSNLPVSEESIHPIQAMVVSPDGSVVASFSANRELALWRIDTGVCMHRLECPHRMEYLEGASSKPPFAFLTRLLFCAWTRSTLYIYRVDTGQRVSEVDKHHGSEVAFSPDGSRIAFRPSEDTIYTMMPDSGEYGHQLTGGRRLSDPRFSPDSTRVAAISYTTKNSHVHVWSVEDGVCLHRLRTRLPPNATKAHISGISPDGRWVAVQWVVDEERASRGVRAYKRVYFLEVISVAPGDVGMRFNTPSSKPPGDCSFSSGSQHVAWVCGSSMRVWDTATGALTHHVNLGFSPSRIDFDIGRDYPFTNFGRININSPPPEDVNGAGISPGRLGYGVSADMSWLMWNDMEFFWLPPRFRPHEGCAIEISGSTIIIGSETGVLLFFRFTLEETLSRHRIVTIVE
ncbi:NACHT domain-containing protein [Fusarium keratoplasticum]|uniref:NACHT domain-containing protein n=1 Tax=Fusarium keratoplasticum TaxID=1328300 RepID=A0ACC0R2M1_9HYPO|nr:NACHT domain-containing protein [Fusarium keratoplasticum]KAI8674545.1 NACHT domain-containing protein [Fusarium keratoplasticum]